jgi:hypothetical protein
MIGIKLGSEQCDVCGGEVEERHMGCDVGVELKKKVKEVLASLGHGKGRVTTEAQKQHMKSVNFGWVGFGS